MTRRAPPFRSLILTSLIEAAWVGVLFAAVTIVVTWPQASVLTTASHGHHDALFSMWRLAWIGHALSTAGTRLFDAPIFAPVDGTLAFSDAVLLQGLLAWPWLSADVPALTVYNLLLLAGMWTSALGAYLLARRLTGSRAAGVVAGLVFGYAPYRFEHAMHLELQWSAWMPLTLWALHRTWAEGRRRDGVLTGAFIACQFLSGIYYGVFLGLFLVLLAPALFWWERPRYPWRTCLALVIGALVALPPVVAYGVPYRANQRELGGRSAEEIAQWSALPQSYLAVPPENRMYGPYLSDLGTPEGRLFPGLTAVVLAGLGLLAGGRHARLAAVYGWGLVWTVLLSFGTHTPVYAALLRVVPPLDGLRAPARFAMVALLALAVLAAIGTTRLLEALQAGVRVAPGPTRDVRRRTLVAALLAVLLAGALTAEYATAFGPLHPWPRRAPVYAAWLETQPPGAVVELPAPRGHALPLYEAEWSFIGTFHWKPLVNGYSGYFPRPYLDLLGALAGFPSGESLWVLGRREVRYVVLHEDRYPPEAFMRLLGDIERYPCLQRVGRFPDATYPVTIYTLCEAPEGGASTPPSGVGQKK